MAPVVAFNDTERAQLETLVDNSAITRAKTKHAEATAARDRIKQEYEAAKAAAETASANYQAALRGEVATSPLDAFHAMDAAIKARDVAGEVLNHVSQALHRAESGISEGMGHCLSTCLRGRGQASLGRGVEGGPGEVDACRGRGRLSERLGGGADRLRPWVRASHTVFPTRPNE